jgi:hypothetical protein
MLQHAHMHARSLLFQRLFGFFSDLKAMAVFTQVKILGSGRKETNKQKKPYKLKARKNLPLSTLNDRK